MKLDEIQNWRRTHYSDEIIPQMDGKEVILMGWVKEIRDLGGIRFVLLKDKKGNIQITFSRKKINREIMKKLKVLQKQYVIGLKGIVKKIDKAPRGVEIIPKSLKILGIAKHPLDIDITEKTKAEIDIRLDARILDLISERSQAIFKIRHKILQVVRKFFIGEGFIEINTPKIISSATEGGAALFPIAYFEHEAFLAQSPQLYKEELTIDFEKVYEIGPAYRAEKSDTRRHITEFMSIDIEESFVTKKDVMNLAEKLIFNLCKNIIKECNEELKILKYNLDVPKIPFKRISYNEVIEQLQKNDIKINFGDDISTYAYRKLGKIYKNFYFITDWPLNLKPFYIKAKKNNPKISEGFDLMWSWIEIASGGTRINNKSNLIQRLQENGLDPRNFKTHLKTFDYGMPPHAGWAIGLERLVMACTNIKNIREVILFPRDRYRLRP